MLACAVVALGCLAAVADAAADVVRAGGGNYDYAYGVAVRPDGAALRQFVILLLNPVLLEPQYHKQILLPLLSLLAALPPPCVDRLVFWWSLLPCRQLEQMLLTLNTQGG